MRDTKFLLLTHRNQLNLRTTDPLHITQSSFQSSLRELITSKRVVEVPFKPTLVNPLSVSSNKGKKRLILDLRYVKLHIWKDRVKFEDWKVFSNYLTKDGYIFKLDLKSGYHHLDIYPHTKHIWA